MPIAGDRQDRDGDVRGWAVNFMVEIDDPGRAAQIGEGRTALADVLRCKWRRRMRGQR